MYKLLQDKILHSFWNMDFRDEKVNYIHYGRAVTCVKKSTPRKPIKINKNYFQKHLYFTKLKAYSSSTPL